MPSDEQLSAMGEDGRSSVQTATESQLLKTPVAALIEVYPDAIFIYDAAGRIVTMNSRAQRLFNLDGASHFTALPIAERLPMFAPRALDGRPLDESEWHITRILNGETITERDAAIARMRSLDGRELTLGYTGAPIRDEQGDLIGAFAIIHDLTERRRLEDEAQARAAELEAILDAITDGIYVYDRGARLIRANTAARRFNPQTGQGAYLERDFEERIAPVRIWDESGHPVSPEDGPVMRVLRGEALTGESAVDSVVQFPDGHVAHVNTTGAPVTDARGDVTGGVIVTRDVTAHRQLAQHTRDSLDALLAMARAAVGAPLEDGLEGATTGPSAAIRELAALARRVITCERVTITAVDEDERLIPVAAAGVPEQEAAQWAATLSGSRLTDYLPPALIARLRSGEAFSIGTTASPRREASFGSASALLAPMLIGSRLTGVLSIASAPGSAEYTEAELSLASAVAQLVTLVLERDRLVRESAAAEARVLALTETTRRMDAFLGVVSHELRTPLTVVSASLQLAARRIERMREGLSERPPEEWRVESDLRDLAAVLHRALGASSRQGRLVNDLLDVSRMKSGKLELRRTLCDLREIVGETLEDLRANESERALRLEAPDAPLLALADPDRVSQVITNFVLNALKYSAPETPVEVTLARRGEVARLSVRDEGPGIPLEERERVWELFYRAPGIYVRSGSGVGLGLGLHISKTIVERHGGQVGIEGPPDEGAVFWFTLPLASENTDAGIDLTP